MNHSPRHRSNPSHTSSNTTNTTANTAAHKIARAAAAIAITTVATSASAVALNPGQTQPLSGTTFAANPNLGGTVIADGLRPFELAWDFNPSSYAMGGNVQDRVVRSSNTGTLIFSPRFRDLENLPGSFEFDHIHTVEMFGFGSYSLDVDYRTDGLGNSGPTSVSRSVGDGSTLTFDMSLWVSNSGRFLSIMTQAEHYAPVGRMTITGSEGGANQFSQTIPIHVPIPHTMGDVNGDGEVNLLDLDILGQNWGNQEASWDDGDMNKDGRVNLVDLDYLGSNWGDGARAFDAALSASGIAVPEPGSLGLLAAGSLMVARRRRNV